ncbi:MAG: glycosyltransferase family 4 protein [Ruminococcaceae bacterium]|nr:glycosyltransferase family 4 protein [Oscillospiraceae bacterium]
MKILVICQYYEPEPMRISDICRSLVLRGHEVDVITGVPNYPMGTVYDGYRHGKRRNEILDGVSVHRCFTIARRKGILFRFLNYYSYAISSTWYAAKLRTSYDAIFVNQLSPVMMAAAAVAYRKKHGTPLTLYCLDLWPESLTAGGIRRGSLLYRLFHRISGRLYRQADRILVTSRQFIPYLSEQFGIPMARLSHLPQYAEDLFTPEETPHKDTVDLTFAGNIGAAQSVETILRAAAKLTDLSQLRIHLVGEGSSLAACQALAQELALTNVIFHGRRPLEEMPDFYRRSDAMLVTLARDPLLSLTLPGKVQTYMAAGKPILGAIDGEAAAVITESSCGLVGPAEDADALADNIRLFVATHDKEVYGRRAAAYYHAHFRKDSFLDALEEALQESLTKGH